MYKEDLNVTFKVPMTMGTIVVVEDNEASRDAMATRLERCGFEVVVATDGLEAVMAGRELVQ